MQILNRFIDFSYELVKLEPFELYPTNKDLETAFNQFCGYIFKHQLVNVTTYHLFLNPNPSVGWFCGGGIESTLQGYPQCGATQLYRSLLCDWSSSATQVQTAAHEIGHSLGLGHDCTLITTSPTELLRWGTCNLMFSKDPKKDIYGNGPCIGWCLGRREFISDESLFDVEQSSLCNPKHLPQSCPRGCGAPRGTCDSMTGICGCSTGFSGPGCDRCAPGYTGYPNCRIPAPSCTDGLRNGTETDIDCGGGCPKCNVGRACSSGSDCTTGLCSGNVCQPMPVGPCSGGPMPKVTWQPRLVAPAPNTGMSSTVLQGKIHILGGFSGAFKHAAFTPTTNSWQTLNELPTSNAFTDGIAAVVNNTLYAFDNGSGVGTSYTYQYDAVADSWMAVAPNPFARRNSIVGVLGNKIYQATGYAGNDEKVTVYDPASDRFSVLTSLDPKSSVGSGGVLSGKLYVFGIGSSRNEAHVYNPATGVWTPLSADTQYHYGSKTIEHNGIFWVMGGQNASSIPIDTVSLYDPAADKWCSGPKLPEPLMFFVAEEVNGKIYLIGGVNSSSQTDHVWEGTVS